MRPYEVILNEVTKVVSLTRFLDVLLRVTNLNYPMDFKHESVLEKLSGLTDLEKYELGQVLFRVNVPEVYRILIQNEDGTTTLSPHYKQSIVMIVHAIEWPETDLEVAEYLSAYGFTSPVGDGSVE